jgi:outer membrane protein
MKYLFLLASLLLTQPAWAQQPKPVAKPAAGSAQPAGSDESVQIGYIDGVRVENDTRRAFEISEALRKEFSSREAEVRAMEEKVKGLQQQVQSTTQPRERELREREFQTQLQRLQQMGRALVDDIERRKAEERRKYFAEVTVIVNRIAEAQKLDLVLQEAVFAGRAVDLTDQVIKQLGGPAPGSPSAAGVPAGAPAATGKPPAKPPAK